MERLIRRYIMRHIQVKDGKLFISTHDVNELFYDICEIFSLHKDYCAVWVMEEYPNFEHAIDLDGDQYRLWDGFYEETDFNYSEEL